ncbi:hypothetical protein ZEAMMB73_Zm00001d035413 [Zea mays]|uniref:Uncharacterized protein n=1 Tax=Zea mays TaxID=4577 RepID=A0A1D6LGB4_MAIZE|nr:hypothetical protein ZEAMMB73_Zm00001d035413 [Zea mays]
MKMRGEASKASSGSGSGSSEDGERTGPVPSPARRAPPIRIDVAMGSFSACRRHEICPRVSFGSRCPTAVRPPTHRRRSGPLRPLSAAWRHPSSPPPPSPTSPGSSTHCSSPSSCARRSRTGDCGVLVEDARDELKLLALCTKGICRITWMGFCYTSLDLSYFLCSSVLNK